jgi:hypothetical protein
MFTEQYAKLIYFKVVTLALTLLFSKLGILLFYRSVFGVNAKFRVATAVGIFITTSLFILEFILATYSQTPPPGKSWRDSKVIPGNNKGKDGVVWGVIAVGAGSVFLDVFIFFLPLPILARLNMSKSKRLQLVAVFGTAIMYVYDS